MLALAYIPICAFAQTTVTGRVSAGDSVQLSISSVIPGEFPLIEVLFRAENLSGYPYWGLEKSDLRIFENEQLCNIVELRHFSEREPINISIVIDHSGSMSGSFSDYIEYYKQDTIALFNAMMNGTLPALTSPLDNAVTAVKGFLENFDTDKDLIGLYAFNSVVDVQISPTSDLDQIKTNLDSLTPDASTAFFDAVYLATESLLELDGIRVVIALTDGQDNSSKKHSEDVISLARENEIPIYCIGLGDAMPDTLQILADSTDGYYAYTNNSSALDSIYDLLNRKILAYYLLTYESPNWSSLDIDRTLTIEFEQTDVYVRDNALGFKLPDNVINYLKEKEQKEFQYMMAGVVCGSVLIIGLTAFMLRRRNKKMEILKLYPNPGDGNCTLEIELGAHKSANLVVTDSRGVEVYNTLITQNDSVRVDLSGFPSGNYSLFLQADNEKSKGKTYIKK